MIEPRAVPAQRLDNGKGKPRSSSASLALLGNPTRTQRQPGIQEAHAALRGGRNGYGVMIIMTEAPRELLAVKACVRMAEYTAEEEDYQAAEAYYQRAVGLAESEFGPESADAALCLVLLAEFYADQGRHAEAEALYRRALVIQLMTLAPQDPVIGITMRNLAEVCEAQGDLDEADHLRVAAREQFATQLSLLKLDSSAHPRLSW